MTTKRAGNLPFSNPVGDSLELMKKMWGFAGLPGFPTPGNLASMAARVPQQLPNMFAPTLDVDELEKRIADLRAVEQWLELNAGILRTTIQSLEVQRATIATLKGISGAMLAPMMKGTAMSAPPEVQLGLAAMKTEEASAAVPRSETPKAAVRASKQSIAPSAVATAPFNPAAWWNTVQDQFVKAVTPAGEPRTPASSKKSTKPRRARKSR